jgi:hypothetical protein
MRCQCTGWVLDPSGAGVQVHETGAMIRRIRDSFVFLVWLAVLLTARLAVVLFCVAEVVLVVVLWMLAVIQ